MLGFDMDSILGVVGFLILAGLILSNWNGANSLLSTGLSGGSTLVKDLQLR